MREQFSHALGVAACFAGDLGKTTLERGSTRSKRSLQRLRSRRNCFSPSGVGVALACLKNIGQSSIHSGSILGLLLGIRDVPLTVFVLDPLALFDVPVFILLKVFLDIRLVNFGAVAGRRNVSATNDIDLCAALPLLLLLLTTRVVADNDHLAFFSTFADFIDDEVLTTTVLVGNGYVTGL